MAHLETQALHTLRAALAALALLCALALAAVPAARADLVSGTADRYDSSPPLRTLEPSRSTSLAAHPARRFGTTLDELRLEPQDRGRQAIDAPAAAPILGTAWEGISNRNGVVPPDTVGDVGPRDYVQWVNLSLAVYDKATGAPRYGPVNGNTLWQGFGGVCETTNQGDPFVAYDRQADRWVLMQFAFTVKGGSDAPPFRLCVAVSRTGDPTGAYNRYEFNVGGDTTFPDYPKLGVWNDAYYVTTNNFSGSKFLGAGTYALDRTSMLAGAPAKFAGSQLSSSYGGLLPADADGAMPPPAGTPGYFAGIDSSATTGAGSTLQVWRMHPDFSGPSATATVTGPVSITVPEYRFAWGCSSRPDCVPQKGTTRRLDTLADRLMNRLQYRNFGDHESLVAVQNVNVGSGSTDVAGERWYELRDPGAATPTIRQSGTYAPADGLSRWMGSAALDGYGNLALAYSASGPNDFPSIRYTGQLAGTPLGQMSEGEQTLQAGSGSQTGYPRWGDYSSLTVDPVDDSTFWYTNEYYTTSSTSAWHTRIASFKLVRTPPVTLAAPADGSGTGASPSFTGVASTAAGDSSSVTAKVWAGTSTSGAPVQTLTTGRDATTGAWSADPSPALGEGTYTVQAQQADSSGHTGYSRISTFRVDATAPAPVVASPAAGSSTNDSTPVISGTAGTAPGDLAQLSVRVHAGPSVSDPVAQTLTATRAAGGAWSVTVPAALADGGHAVEALQSDTVGNQGTSAPVTFTVDTSVPVVALTQPAAGARTKSTTPTFAGTAGAAPGDLPGVTVQLFGGTSAAGTPVQTRSATAGIGGSWSVDATALAQGTYTAVARQSDSAGNSGTSAPVTFAVDTTAPAPSVTTPAPGSVTNDDTPSLGGAAGNSTGDLATVTVRVYAGGGLGGSPLQTLAAPRSAAAWSTVAGALGGDGQYTVQAEQSDSAGNTGTGAPVTFTLDSQPPQLTIGSPADGATTTSTPRFSGTASDAGTVTVKFTGGPAQASLATTRNSDGTWSATLAGALASGTYTVHAEEVDAAGNLGSSAPVTFTVPGNSPPVPSFTFAPAAPVVGAPVAFDAGASSDPDGTIDSYAWTFGDGGSASGAQSSHAYAVAGSYSAQLTVTDDRGATAAQAQGVTVGVVPDPVTQAQSPAGEQHVQGVGEPDTLTVRIARQRLAAVLRRGLAITLLSSADGTAGVRLGLSPQLAGRLGLRQATVANTAPRVARGRPATVRLVLRRRARGALAKRRTVPLTLRAALGATSLVQPVVLHR